MTERDMSIGERKAKDDALRKRIHDYYFNMTVETQKFSASYAIEVIKLLASVGSAGFAGCVALLTSQLVAVASRGTIAEAAFFFGLGGFGSLVAAAVAYVCQMLYAKAAPKVELLDEHPYSRKLSDHGFWHKAGIGAHVTAVLIGVGSIASIAWAGLLVLRGLGQP